MEYYAHISDDGRRQTVAEHCRKDASYAAECLSSVGLSNTAYLAGLMHDTGKLTQEYQTYLERAARGEAVRRGSVVHTFAGVRLRLKCAKIMKLQGIRRTHWESKNYPCLQPAL